MNTNYDSGNAVSAFDADLLKGKNYDNIWLPTYDILIDSAGGGNYADISTAVSTEAAGTTFFVRSGTYNPSADIVLKNNQKIVGENLYKTIINLGDKKITCSSVDGIVIQNFYIQGHKYSAAYSSSALDIDTVTNSVFNNLYFYDNRHTGGIGQYVAAITVQNASNYNYFNIIKIDPTTTADSVGFRFFNGSYNYIKIGEIKNTNNGFLFQAATKNFLEFECFNAPLEINNSLYNRIFGGSIMSTFTINSGSHRNSIIGAFCNNNPTISGDENIFVGCSFPTSFSPGGSNNQVDLTFANEIW